jgi:hypothetical protein
MKKDVIELLSKPYFLNVKKVRVIETAISWVFLADNTYVYKLKKPIKLSYLDYSTLKKRKYYCEREVELNKRLSPDIYLGVCKVTGNGLDKSGRILDYVVKMVQLPQDSLMRNLLMRNEVSKKTIIMIAKKIADFHRDAERTDDYGSLSIIVQNWLENFSQIAPYANKVISQSDLDLIRKYVLNFINDKKTIFEKRVSEGRIGQCHGDLHSENIFIVDHNPIIFDCIEFNDRFACGDTASEVAFLAMDLDFTGNKNLSKLFVDNYVEFSRDDLDGLLDFYKLYRAFVRGKIACFRNDFVTAKKYFKLCCDYIGMH